MVGAVKRVRMLPVALLLLRGRLISQQLHAAAVL
jgi:hypothetical protein